MVPLKVIQALHPAEVFIGAIMLIFFIVSLNLWELAILIVLSFVLL
jgi:hypothetical protein